MPRKRACRRKDPSLQFPTLVPASNQGSYESRLREWTKIRDNLETQVRASVELHCKQYEDDISQLLLEHLSPLESLLPQLLDAPYELLVECEYDPAKLQLCLTKRKVKEPEHSTRNAKRPITHFKPPLGRTVKKQLPSIDSGYTNNGGPVAMETPACVKLCDQTNLLASSLLTTGRRRREGEKLKKKYTCTYQYVSETGSPISVNPTSVNPGLFLEEEDEEQKRLLHFLPKKCREKFVSKIMEAGYKIAPVQNVPMLSVDYLHANTHNE